MLEQEVKEITDEKLPAKNLKYALLAVGYAILASLAFYLALDSFGPRTGRFLIWVMLGLYYLLTIVSGVYAFLACRDSLKSLKTDKNVRNYIALVIGGLLLLGICREILRQI
jgi:hypothetical protein